MYTQQDTRKEVEHFKKILNEMADLKERKANDYGNSWKLGGLQGLLWQINSKVFRINNIIKRGVETRNEPLKDSFKDLANYAVMAVQLLEMGDIDDVFSTFGESDKIESIDDIKVKLTQARHEIEHTDTTMAERMANE